MACGLHWAVFLLFCSHWNDSTWMADNIVVGCCRVLFWPIIEEDVSLALTIDCLGMRCLNITKLDERYHFTQRLSSLNHSFVSACSIYAVTKLGDPGFGQATIAIVAVMEFGL